MAQSTCSKIAVGITALVGVACLIVGGIMYVEFPKIVEKKIRESLPLENGTEGYKRWTDSTVPIYWKVYFFNITNPADVRNNSKPILKEVGPYVFRQEKRRENIKELKEKNGTSLFQLQYDDYRTYFHESGNINDEINHLNALYVIMADTASSSPKFLPPPFKDEDIKTLREMVENETLSLVETHTVEELLFKGYDSELIRQAKKMKGTVRTIMRMKYPKDNIFGLYYEKNGTKQNSYVIGTGGENIQELDKTIKFNKRDESKLWKSWCGILNGTDGTMYPPGVSKNDVLYAFVAEIDRSVYFEYRDEVAVKDISAHKFVLSENVFAITTENECFCIEICETGLLKLVPPLGDIVNQKIIFSAPHFYLVTNKTILDAVEGLNPVKENHETYIDVEPNTGVVIEAAKRLQVSAHFKSSNLNLPLLEDVNEIIFPIAWFEESATIDSSTAKDFRSRIMNPLNLGPKLLLALIGVGAFFVLLSTIVCIYKRRK